MAAPLIVYDDGSVTWWSFPLFVGDGDILAPAAINAISNREYGETEANWRAARLTLLDNKSASGSNLSWAAAAVGVDEQHRYPTVVLFAAGGTIQSNWLYSASGTSGWMRGPGAVSSTNIIDIATNASVLHNDTVLPSGGSVRAVAIIGKRTNHRAHQLIASFNPIELPKPPQTAYPRVTPKWMTYPVISSQGDFLGSYGRPVTGMLDITIDNVSNDWIVNTWEPFRKHVSLGGIFAYCLDWENDPGNVAFCFASGSVPPPQVKAGGYGTVSLKAGVANFG